MSGFNLYHTDHPVNGLDCDCLYYRVSSDNFVYQVIKYYTRYQLDKQYCRVIIIILGLLSKIYAT